MKPIFFMGLLAAATVAGCTTTGTSVTADPANAIAPPSLKPDMVDEARLDAALSSPDRPDTDTERDEMRMPGATLAFTGLQPGDTLLEMEAGSGYFTEIFSAYLGEGGTLYMQNPAGFDSLLGDTVSERMEGLENVTYLKSDFDEFDLEDGSVDVVTWFQGPHELWFEPDGASLVSNPDASFPEVFRVLKPGGTFVVLDHTAPAGSPATTGGDTHRIDPQIVRDLGREAGFVLISESDLLGNPDDDLTANVFDEKVRGRTDQFLIKFEKPEAG